MLGLAVVSYSSVSVCESVRGSRGRGRERGREGAIIGMERPTGTGF